MEYIVGHHDRATNVANQIIRNAPTLDSKFRARCVLLEVETSGKDRNRDRGVELCLDCLKSYNIDLPRSPGKIRIAYEKNRMKKSLPNGRLEDLIYMPVMTDVHAMHLSVFLSKLTTYCILLGGEFLPLLKFASLKVFNLACTYGINSYIALTVGQYGILQRLEGKFEKAFNTASISEEMLKNDSLEAFMEALVGSDLSSDFHAQMDHRMGYGYNYILVGYPLAALEKDMASYAREARQFGLSGSLQAQFSIMLQTALNLQGKSSYKTLLKGTAMNQEDMLSKEVEGKGRSMTRRDICIFRLMLACVYGSLDVQQDCLDVLATYPAFNPAIARMHMWQVFAGFAGFQLYHKTKKQKYLSVGNKSLDYFKTCVSHGSLNAYPMMLFLQAAKTSERKTIDNAIKVCSRSGLVNFQAILTEKAALKCLERNDEEQAFYYMEKAVGLYHDWGATGKAIDLVTRHGKLLGSSRSCSFQTAMASSSISRHLNYRQSVTSSIQKVEFDGRELSESYREDFVAPERGGSFHFFGPVPETHSGTSTNDTAAESIVEECDPVPR
ncbi:MAG: hypothetical protein SGILL_004204 [Bacillariaceae sp.]